MVDEQVNTDEETMPLDETPNQDEQPIDDQNTHACPTCPTCTLDAITMAMGANYSACAGLGDADEKQRCLEDAAKIDPNEVKDAKDVYLNILTGPAGMDGLTKASIAFNVGVREAIIEHVSGQLDRSEKVDDREFAAYQTLLLGRKA